MLQNNEKNSNKDNEDKCGILATGRYSWTSLFLDCRYCESL